MKKIVIACSIAVVSVAAQAQTDADALRYSMTGFGGTARYSAMGGAFGAIGADFSTLSTNPAGLGVYRKNEFTFTPSVYSGETNSSYNGSSAGDIKYNINFGNIGIVRSIKTGKTADEDGWKSVNFAFGLNRNNNFHNRIIIDGLNNTSSIMDVYKNAAQGINYKELDPFSTMLAFNTYLIDTSGGASHYISNVPSGGISQRKNIETTGAMQEMIFSLGANYNNKLYIGGTLGVPFIRYEEISNYKEIDADDTLDSDNFRSLAIHENLSTSGTGFNFKFGLIYVPVDVDALKVKIGAAIHTPAFYSLTDTWSKKMDASYDDGDRYSYKSPEGTFNYEITAPMRAIGSLAIQIGKYGTISADYEFVDYSEARIRSKSEDFFGENEAIRGKYTVADNLRVGAEAVIGLVSLRGGYAIYSSPYSSGLNDAAKTSFTGGIGIIDKNYFLDFAYVYTSSKEDYYLYNGNNINPAKLEITSQALLITLGFKF